MVGQLQQQEPPSDSPLRFSGASIRPAPTARRPTSRAVPRRPARRGGGMVGSRRNVYRIRQHRRSRWSRPGAEGRSRGRAILPARGQRADAFRRDADADRPGVSPGQRSGSQPSVLESSYLRGHRWLRAVIDGGQVADPNAPLGTDGGPAVWQARSGGILVRCVAGRVEPRDHCQQIHSQAR